MRCGSVYFFNLLKASTVSPNWCKRSHSFHHAVTMVTFFQVISPSCYTRVCPWRGRFCTTFLRLSCVWLASWSASWSARTPTPTHGSLPPLAGCSSTYRWSIWYVGNLRFSVALIFFLLRKICNCYELFTNCFYYQISSINMCFANSKANKYQKWLKTVFTRAVFTADWQFPIYCLARQ